MLWFTTPPPCSSESLFGVHFVIPKIHADTTIRMMGLNYDMQLIMSGILNIMQLVGIITSVWTMDRVGRRRLLLCGAVGMLTCHIITAVLVGEFAGDWPAHTTESWVSVAFMLVFMVVYGSSWGPVGWAVPAEVFPSSLRAKGVAFAVCLNWISNFIIVSVWPPRGEKPKEKVTDRLTSATTGSYHAASGRIDQFWCVRLLRRLLLRRVRLRLPLRARDQRPVARGDGRGVWRQHGRRRRRAQAARAAAGAAGEEGRRRSQARCRRECGLRGGGVHWRCWNWKDLWLMGFLYEADRNGTTSAGKEW